MVSVTSSVCTPAVGREATMDLLAIVEKAWTAPFRTKSDFARENADAVAAAACRGLITTSVNATDHGRDWLATPDGLASLWAARRIVK